ncbi:amidase [Musicola paradisiaca]|uniref:Amidase n=1 Tax=Musicola paradisiaca (strain Ech703) TaxID=579405 RepID=C6C3B0_MUSP7|nr:amidase [Musicola paradisiaca]ACS87208.1 Amidase [Musicola paradisiaca Ech703]
MNEQTLMSLATRLAQGSLSAVELTREALARIADPAGEGARVFTQVYGAWALEQASVSDRLLMQGAPRSALEGIPVSVKDLFDVSGEPTTAGSRVLRDVPAASGHAAVVARLLQAGAVVLGKTNMTEFAYSGLGLNPHYGTPANPWDRLTRRIPGGSSSGAAVSVADGMCYGAIGSDTGGSVRIPAAFCGLVGFKPTAQRIDRAGVLPLSTALDSVGVIARDVAGCVALDSVVAHQPLTLKPKRLAQARFVVPQTLVLDNLDDSVAAAFDRALSRLSAAGVEIVELPSELLAELASINAGGGFSALESWRWHQALIARRAAEYDPRVLSRIRKGEALGDAQARELASRRVDWQQRAAATWQGFDAVLMPTVPMVAPAIDELAADENAYFAANGLALRNTAIFNFLDGCAISLPCHRPGDAPVGLMAGSLHGRDDELLSWARELESCLN